MFKARNPQQAQLKTAANQSKMATATVPGSEVVTAACNGPTGVAGELGGGRGAPRRRNSCAVSMSMSTA